MYNRLYSPWRYPYIVSEHPKGCILCIEPDNDDDRLVVHRTINCFVIINLYPYNNGHIMVVPVRHIANLSDLSRDESMDIFSNLTLSEQVIKKNYKPDGINIGINLGKAAGAGIDEHLHIHLVPRWSGDANYMTSVADTRVIPESFENAFQNLKKTFKEFTR